MGRHVLALLAERGQTARTLLLPGDPAAEGIAAQGFEVVYGDITEAASLGPALAGVRQVLHLAGLVNGGRGDPADFMRVNAGGTENLAHAAAEAGVEHLVYSSSITIYGLVRDAREDHPLEATPGYPASKIAAEEHLRAILPEQHTILRLPLVIGAGDAGFMLPAVQGFRQSGQAVVVGSGQQPWSVLAAHDAARALLFALDHPETRGGLYNVNGATITNGELMQALGEAAGCTRTLRLPYALAWSVALLGELMGQGPLTRDQTKALSSPLSFDGSRFAALGFEAGVDWRDALTAGVNWAIENL
ncbi:MAG: hypothetical protein Kow00124_32230 [Anaerolineae bacterium]